MACPVCFGGEDPVVRESLNAGIGVLMGVTAIVLGCFGRFFVVLARRARAADSGGDPFFEGNPASRLPGEGSMSER